MTTRTAASDYEHIRVEIADGVGWIVFDRPDVLNAMVPEMMGEVIGAVEAMNGEDDVRALVFTGAGKGFSAGGDMDFLEAMTKYRPLEIKATVYKYFAGAVRTVKLCPKPTLAAVNGPAAGAGCEVALACDFRIAAEPAFFRETWIDLGLISPLGGMFLLPQLVGLSKANEMLLLGRKVGAAEALEIGLVNEVVPADQLRDRAGELAAQLAAGPPLAMSAMKEGIRRGMESSLAAEWEHNVWVQGLLIDSDDFAEGVKAMQEKRRPDFQGK